MLTKNWLGYKNTPTKLNPNGYKKPVTKFKIVKYCY